MNNNQNFPQRPATFPTNPTQPMMPSQQQQLQQPPQGQQPFQAQPGQSGPQQNFAMMQGQSVPPQGQNFPSQQQSQFPPNVPPQNMQFPIPGLDKSDEQEDAKSDHSSELLDNLEELPPSHTIYINNLNERVKIDDMKESLQEVFEEYGAILQILAKKNIKMRGQAFIVFQDIQAAIDAKDQMQGAKIYGKAMRINFARTKSDVISKAEGTFLQREKTKLSLKEQIENQKEQKAKQQREKLEKQILQQQQLQQKQAQQMAQQQTASISQQPQTNQQKQPPRPQVVPHNILFVENLSPAVTQETLVEVFLQCNGFKEIRLIQAKRVAFVEFEDEFQAGIAMNSLLGTQILDCQLQISYAKK